MRQSRQKKRTHTTTRLMVGLILVTEDRTPIVPSTAGLINSSGFLALTWKGEAWNPSEKRPSAEEAGGRREVRRRERTV